MGMAQRSLMAGVKVWWTRWFLQQLFCIQLRELYTILGTCQNSGLSSQKSEFVCGFKIKVKNPTEICNRDIYSLTFLQFLVPGSSNKYSFNKSIALGKFCLQNLLRYIKENGFIMSSLNV
jgi:hypothetical protein